MERDDLQEQGSTSPTPAPSEGWMRAFRSDARALLGDPVAVRGLVSAAIGTVILLLPAATTTLVSFVVIGLMFLAGGMDVFYALTGRRWFGGRTPRLLAAPRGLAAIAFAAAMVFLTVLGAGVVTLSLTVGVLGLYLAVRGVISVVAAVMNRRRRDPVPGLARGGVAILLAVLALTVPSSVVTASIVTVATAALLLGLVMIAWAFRGPSAGSGLDPATATVPEVVWDWIVGADIGRKERSAQAATLYFERPGRRNKLGTWWVMLILSVAIASFAVIADSTAVVIGAMLVAPLMTPILGLAGAMVNGWARRALHSAVLVAAGTIASIVLAYGIAGWSPVAISFATNSQITSRVSPNTVDLLIAIAAGAAGAFATVNSRVASGIAGVAIAVALVPPLAVVGISLNGGRFDDASGAALLFLTNFVAIVLAAALVFVLTGFARPFALRHRPRQLLSTVAPVLAGAAIILVPLMTNAESLLHSETRAREATATVTDWLGSDTEFVITDVRVEDDTVAVDLTGPGSTPAPSDLLDALQDDFLEPVGLDLHVTPVDVTQLDPPS
ncbi:DUF389 domain-containing protein [Microbacterium xanthum]|uniref:DUF389 domain-containing protein n=1 Tax=Microbacterium xanthum TaxID=3079794 RepID=UPI002AD540F3|nr:DUF389 domain-containing protein [Microbacterium sp. KSW-48]MDZ8173176.1 DUF389 domain-containing protein [Microbacterium sp. KSW-48]